MSKISKHDFENMVEDCIVTFLLKSKHNLPDVHFSPCDDPEPITDILLDNSGTSFANLQLKRNIPDSFQPLYDLITEE